MRASMDNESLNWDGARKALTPERLYEDVQSRLKEKLRSSVGFLVLFALLCIPALLLIFAHTSRMAGVVFTAIGIVIGLYVLIKIICICISLARAGKGRVTVSEDVLTDKEARVFYTFYNFYRRTHMIYYFNFDKSGRHRLSTSEEGVYRCAVEGDLFYIVRYRSAGFCYILYYNKKDYVFDR